MRQLEYTKMWPNYSSCIISNHYGYFLLRYNHNSIRATMAHGRETYPLDGY